MSATGAMFREYFEAHRALIAATVKRERMSSAHIVGFRAEGNGKDAAESAKFERENARLKRIADAAWRAEDRAKERFAAALAAIKEAESALPSKRVKTHKAWADVGSHGGIYVFEIGPVADRYPSLMHVHEKQVTPDLVPVTITEGH